MIGKLKLLIGEDIDDALIEIYIDRSVASIINYLKKDGLDKALILNKYEPAVLLMVENAHTGNGERHIKSWSQGGRSVSYGDSINNSMTEDVKRLLPYPSLRVM